MNTTYRQAPTRFAPESRFELEPTEAAPCRAAEEERFETLKHRMLLASLLALPDSRSNIRLRRAANEAAAIAWLTPYPALVFPVLFEEKAQAGLAYARRQRRVSERSAQYLAA